MDLTHWASLDDSSDVSEVTLGPLKTGEAFRHCTWRIRIPSTQALSFTYEETYTGSGTFSSASSTQLGAWLVDVKSDAPRLQRMDDSTTAVTTALGSSTVVLYTWLGEADMKLKVTFTYAATSTSYAANFPRYVHHCSPSRRLELILTMYTYTSTNALLTRTYTGRSRQRLQ